MTKKLWILLIALLTIIVIAFIIFIMFNKHTHEKTAAELEADRVLLELQRR
ncbi:MAG TPA: hypothetical protein VIG45_00715 [Erysipelothrix sp.]